MRTLRLSTLLAALAAGIVPATAKLKVHEWGTFTVLQSPNGTAVTWYQAFSDTAALPRFVTTGANPLMFSKAMPFRPYAVRMETPVLYFYPDKAMDVTVSVKFQGGIITESYPHTSLKHPAEMLKMNTFQPIALWPGQPQPAAPEVIWNGKLLPVTPENLKSVPDASGPEGRHYAAARAVPEAWLFRQRVAFPELAVQAPPPAVPPVAAATANTAGDGLLPAAKLDAPAAPSAPGAAPATHETDHFIFYRGAGNDLGRNIVVNTTDDRSFSLRNIAPETVPVLFVLRVADGKSAWKRVENLQTYRPTYDDKKKQQIEVGMQTVVMPEAKEPLAKSTAGLKDSMLAALKKAGLTKAEAEAMVATWDNLWFEEPGTRVLAVLPKLWADAVLPLEITPKPEAIERVFVARMELISNAQQNALIELLTKAPDSDAAREQLNQLSLGRFAPGALENAVNVRTQQLNQEMRAKFFQLTQPKTAAAPGAGAEGVPVIGGVQ